MIAKSWIIHGNHGNHHGCFLTLMAKQEQFVLIHFGTCRRIIDVSRLPCYQIARWFSGLSMSFVCFIDVYFLRVSLWPLKSIEEKWWLTSDEMNGRQKVKLRCDMTCCFFLWILWSYYGFIFVWFNLGYFVIVWHTKGHLRITVNPFYCNVSWIHNS